MTTVLLHPHAASSEALRDLYRDHATALLRYAQWFTDDRAAAEDAVQETFLRAWRHLPRLLADGRPLRPYLRQVLRHVLIDADRSARAKRETLHETMPVEGEVDGGYESLLDRGVLAGVLRELSPAHREVLVEVYYRDGSTERVAARLGVPPGTVRSRLHYALRAVRSRLDDAPEPA
jgi:RNA polymerase sigma-70 factor (ECF subfamily)